MKRMLSLLGLSAAMLMAAPVLAQPMAGPPGPGGPPGVRMGPNASPKVRAERRMRMLKNRVGLNEATARRVVAVLAKYDGQRRNLRKQMRTHHRKLVELLRANSNDQGAYRREIQGLKQARLGMQRLRDQEFAELQRILTPKQQAKMLVELTKFRRMRGMKGRRGKGRVHRRHHGRRGQGAW